MTKLIIPDTHIEEKSIPELEKIIKEIFQYEADEVIHLGDFYDKKRPTPDEIYFGTKFALDLKKKYGKVTILNGNHDRSTDKSSAINYLSLLGIKICDTHLDEYNNFYGHFFTDKSLYEYGTHTYTTKQLRKYNHVLLGHQHSPQKVTDTIFHVGSCRYVNFNEVEDSNKQLVLIRDENNIEFLPLKSPISMKDVESIKDLENTPIDTKVRLVFSSFSQFKNEIPEVNKWKKKFHDFKIKLDFETQVKNTQIEISKDKKDFSIEQIITQEIENIEDKDVKKLLKEQFNNGNLSS